MAKIATLPQHHTFLYISFFALLHEYFVKMLNRPSFTFHGESKQVTTKFSVSFSGLQEFKPCMLGSPTFDKVSG